MPLQPYTLDEKEKNACLDVYTKLQSQKLLDMDSIVRQCSEFVPFLQENFSRLLFFLQTYVTHGFGALPVHNLPIADNSESLSIILGFLLGKVVKYQGEGDYVIAVKVQDQGTSGRASFSNSKCFPVHTDLSYVPEPPPYVLLHCIHNDAHEGGYTTLCSLEEVTAYISASTLSELQKSQFIFPPPIHYSGASSATQPVLGQCANGSFRIRFRRDGIRALSRSGIDAIAELVYFIDKLTKEVHIDDNAVLFINNQKCLHGRTAFLPSSSSGALRHLNRVYMA